MGYRLIAIDLDGTLLSDAKLVSPINAAALKRAADRGVKIMISSGRIFPEAESCVAGLDSVSLISACNGADIRDVTVHKSVSSRSISPAAREGIVEILHDSPLFYCLYTHDIVVLEKGIKERFACYKAYIEGRLARSVFVDDIRNPGSVIDDGVYKIYAMSPNAEETARVRALIESRCDVEISSSSVNNIEITAKGVDKGSALAAIGRAYGIPREAMIALGDNENDLPMLRYAGLSIAMGNAEPCVLEAGTAVTRRNDEDGVAVAIEKYILN
jgi:Cof subfamily protein (haloacid dehalogenase superfamily)